MVFAIHDLTWISHGFTCVPHPDPPSHLPLYPIPFLWVFPVHQPWALVSCIQPGLVICLTLDSILVSMLFSQNISIHRVLLIYILCQKKKKCFQIHDLHTQIRHKLPKKKVLKNDSQRKMTHYLHVYFSLLRFFKICMIVKSKNDKIVWWDFQNTYYEIHTTTTK